MSDDIPLRVHVLEEPLWHSSPISCTSDCSPLLHFEDNFVESPSPESPPSSPYPRLIGAVTPALDLSNWCSFPEHRSGWDYAMTALLKLHSDDGVRVVDFMEKTFSWDLAHASNTVAKPSDASSSSSSSVLDKEIWYQNRIWRVAMSSMRLYDAKHTFALVNGDVVSYVSDDLGWVALKDVAPMDLALLPSQADILWKSVWYAQRVWSVPLSTLRLYKGEHAFALDNGEVVAFSRKANEWVQVPLTRDDFALLPTQEEAIRVPWVGFFHNPPRMPLWFDYIHSPRSILERTITRDSLRTCAGIFVFSQYMKDWLKQQPEIPASLPVSVLYHPTAFDDTLPRFSFERFMANQNKTLFQIGYWLRVMTGIAELNAPPCYRKKWLYGNKHAFACLEAEIESRSMTAADAARWRALVDERVEIVDRLNNEQYDEMLTQNLVFLQLYDSSCNNAVIECIVRGTPILVNRLAPVVEYLGEDYPLYFETLEEAAHKLANFDLIRQAHEYLVSNTEIRDRLTDVQFLHDVQQSEVYANVLALRQSQLSVTV